MLVTGCWCYLFQIDGDGAVRLERGERGEHAVQAALERQRRPGHQTPTRDGRVRSRSTHGTSEAQTVDSHQTQRLTSSSTGGHTQEANPATDRAEIGRKLL